MMVCQHPHEGCVVVYEDGLCPLCRSMDEADSLSQKLNAANDEIKELTEVENVNER